MQTYTYKPEDAAQPTRLRRLALRRMVRALLPRYVGHYLLDPKTKWPVCEYWPGDEVWADTIHLHIYWNKTAHWFLFALPDWACRKCPNDQKLSHGHGNCP